VHIQEQQVDLTRLLSVLFFVAFVGLSLFNIGHITFRLRDVRAELANVEGEQLIVSDQTERLGQRIAEMRKLRDKVRAYIEFTRQELPTVEFMAALEESVPDGVKITNLQIRPGSVTMRGSALTDQDISDFGLRLDGRKDITTGVGAPTTTKATLGSRMISDFSISCNLRSISDIASAMSKVSTSGESLVDDIAETLRPDGEGAPR
jgi:hypothetical protein